MNDEKKTVFQKIQNWINEEKGWTFTVQQDDDTIMNMVIYPNKTQNVNVYVHDNESDKLTIITRMSFSPLDIKAYSTLSDEEKKEFLFNLELLLLQINVIYMINPKPPQEMESVELRKQIYFDALTKDRFFDSILSIIRGLQAMQLTYSSLSRRQ